MNSRVAFPFLVLPDTAIDIGDWMIGDPGQPLVVAPAILDNWDYQRDLEIAVEINVDFQVASESLQIDQDDIFLKVSLIAGTGTGGIPRDRRCISSVILHSDFAGARLSGVVSGKALSGQLRLALEVTLDRPPKLGSALSPSDCGSRLWHSSRSVLIEGGGASRFPVEAVSFKKVFRGQPQERAPWYLLWQPDTLQADFSGTVRLYVNSDCETIADRFANSDAETLQSVMGDVVVQMVSFVIEMDDAEEVLQDCGVGSVGAQVDHWISTAFPGAGVDAVRAMKRSWPGKFHSALHALVILEE